MFRGAALGGRNDGVRLGLRVFETAFRFAHQRRGTFQLDGQHGFQFVELACECFAVDSDLGRGEDAAFCLVKLLFKGVDDVVDGSEFRAALVFRIVVRVKGVQIGGMRVASRVGTHIISTGGSVCAVVVRGSV